VAGAWRARLTRAEFAKRVAAFGVAAPLLGAAEAEEDGRLAVAPSSRGPLITPVEQTFVYSQMRSPPAPALSPSSGAIALDGLVRKATSFGYGELRALPHERRILTLECFVNTAGGPLIFTTEFEGVPLARLIEAAGVRDDAVSALVETVDGHPPFLLPLTELRRPGVVLVSRMGGAEASLAHGGAYARLMIPGAGGNHLPKWVTRISFVDKHAPEHLAPPMAGFLAPAPPEAVAVLGGITLTGYAFSGPEYVGAVEISTDDGKTYQAFPALPQPDPNVWVTWALRWQPPRRGFYVLRLRAASASGRKQETPGVLAVEVR